MKVPLVDLVRDFQPIKEEAVAAVTAVLEHQHFILGPEVKKLEEECARYLGTKHAIGVGNGTDALYLSLKALEIKEGDEVITTPFTFIATAEAIAQTGAMPVFADINPHSYNIDIECVKEKITAKTKAIIPVHLYGHSVDMGSLLLLAAKYRLWVVEDACQAFGASFGAFPPGYKVGSLGKFGCFSFFPSKNLGGAGDGGLVVTNDDGLAARIRRLRVHGASQKYMHDELGVNSRLDTVQAAYLLVRLKHIDEWNKKRQEHAAYYTAGLLDVVGTPVVPMWGKSIFHQYTIRTECRDELQQYLREKGIETGIYYPIPLHLQKCFAYLGHKEWDFPHAEKAAKTVLSLPMFPSLTRAEQDYVIASIRSFFNR